MTMGRVPLKDFELGDFSIGKTYEVSSSAGYFDCWREAMLLEQMDLARSAENSTQSFMGTSVGVAQCFTLSLCSYLATLDL